MGNLPSSLLLLHSKILELFYTSILQSVICFSVICWYGNCTTASKTKLTQIILTCQKLGLTNVSSLENLYCKSALQRCELITTDKTHPLHNMYQMLPSGRRMRSVRCRTKRYSDSFVPASIRLLNKGK